MRVGVGIAVALGLLVLGANLLLSRDDESTLKQPPLQSDLQTASQPVEKPVAEQQPTSVPTFVGSPACQSCHAEQYQQWQQSHHHHAFAPARQDTVLGDFNAQPFRFSDGVARFTAPGDEEGPYRITVESDESPDRSREYEVQFALGVYPLQQYILETQPGQYQVFALAWDARPAEQGGQRWFETQPGEIADEQNAFHWQQYFQNWNSQCASCHTTNFDKGYRAAAATQSAAYQSSWAEAGVGCEACHGPGSEHIGWARADADDNHSKGLIKPTVAAPKWTFAEGASIASLAEGSASAARHSQVETCAGCHSLRHPLSDTSFSTTDSHWANQFDPTLVNEPLYFADGQIREEVFVYGSFTQSKMYQAGVVCSDCHNVHSGAVKGFDSESIASSANDAVCAQCHRADIYAVPTHHHHPIDSEAARCVTCHMPERTYMQVDPRRDHSFHKPAPALSQLLGTPNVCTDCHSERDNAWAADQIEIWRGDTDNPASDWDFAHWQLQAASAASTDRAAVEQQRYRLLASSTTPVMKKAMLLASMPIDNADAYQSLIQRLNDAAPEVRLAAINRLAEFDPASRENLLVPALNDEIKAVRLAATLALADLMQNKNFSKRFLLQQRVNQFIATYQQHPDLLHSQVKLAMLYQRTGNLVKSVKAYQRALLMVPDYLLAMINLADVYRMQGNDPAAEKQLLKAIDTAAQAAADGVTSATTAGTAFDRQAAMAHYALGLLYARSKDYSRASDNLAQAARLDPVNTQYFYGWLLALDAQGQRAKALALLAESALTDSDPQLQALQRSWQ